MARFRTSCIPPIASSTPLAVTVAVGAISIGLEGVEGGFKLRGGLGEPPGPEASSTSQQQNFWLSHHPAEQYPCLRSEAHSVAMEMIAMFNPIRIPEQRRE